MIKNIWIRIIVFIFGITFFIFGLIPYLRSNKNDNKEPRKCEICITSLDNGDEVTNSTIIRGVYENIDEDLWIMIWPDQAGNKAYPQSDNALNGASVSKANDRWSVSCYFGGAPQNFDIVLYSATQEASKAIGDTLIKWAKANEYTGIRINDLPIGLQELDRITVRKTQ